MHLLSTLTLALLPLALGLPLQTSHLNTRSPGLTDPVGIATNLALPLIKSLPLPQPIGGILQGISISKRAVDKIEEKDESKVEEKDKRGVLDGAAGGLLGGGGGGLGGLLDPVTGLLGGLGGGKRAVEEKYKRQVEDNDKRGLGGGLLGGAGGGLLAPVTEVLGSLAATPLTGREEGGVADSPAW